MLSNFFLTGDQSVIIETGTYIPFLVIISYIVASLASYTVLDLATHVSHTKDKTSQKIWQYSGAFVLGAGIWSMHFIGMLAYKMDMAISYNYFLTIISMFPPMIVSYFVLEIIKRGKISAVSIIASAILLGIGIASMHYTGMMAMQMDGDIYYRPLIFALSIFVAIAASAVALIIAFLLTYKIEKHIFILKCVAALIMGLAICGMHYTGMAATIFVPWADCRYDPDQSFIVLALSIALVTFMILSLALFLRIQFHSGPKQGLENKNMRLGGAATASISFFVLGFFLSIFSSYFVHDLYVKNDKKQYIQKIEAFSKNVEDRVYKNIETLESIERFHNASLNINVEEFKKYTSPLIKKYKDIIGIYYISETASEEERKHSYTIYFSADSDKNKSLNQSDHLPITTEMDQIFKNALNQESVVFGPALNHADNDESNTYTLVKALPISQTNTNKKKGFIIITSDMNTIIDETRKSNKILEKTQIKIKRSDTNLKNAPSNDYFERNIKTANQNWTLSYEPPKELLNHSKLSEYSILIVGGLLSMMLSAYAYVILKQREKHIELNQELQQEKQQLKEATDRAEQANKTKSDFLANMSHELRTPLNSILGLTRMIADDPDLDPEHKNMADTVLKSSTNLLEIVNDILDISKIESGNMVLETISFDIKDVVTNVIEAMAPISSAKGISLACRYKTANMPFLIGDPFRINRILTNLVSNAIKYTGKNDINGGVTVLIEGGPIVDGVVNIICSVQDSGIGISPNKINTIFEKFIQSDASTTREFGGTGLGLAITKELIELMNGTIKVESKLGEGSRFWFEIPFKIADSLDDETREKVRKERRKERRNPNENRIYAHQARILVAEDHLLNQDFIARLLKRLGFSHFDIVDNGALAIETFKNNNYNIILMDCHMPEKNGYQATQEIRQLDIKNSKDIPIVALTADAMKGTKEKCIEVGMNEYIDKPIDPEILKDILEQWIDFSEQKDKKRIAPKKSSDDSKPVDISLLEEYAETPEDLKGFIKIFKKQSYGSIAILEENCTDGENTPWVEAAHKFKGGAGMIGAKALHKLCSRAQEMAQSTKMDRTKIFNDIKDEYQKVIEFLKTI